MPEEPGREMRTRPNRGRPNGPGTSDRRRTSAPTHTRLLALRVLERVSSAGAYADLLLHSALGRSSLNAPDRAFATDLVYGTLRWRGKIERSPLETVQETDITANVAEALELDREHHR